MFCRTYTGGVRGVEAYCVHVEADVSDGMPCFDIVGYLSSEVKEIKERIRTSLRNSGYRIPPKRVTVNLSPANIRKEGTAFDLAVGVALLCTLGHISESLLAGNLFIGEIGLDGRVRSIKGLLPIVDMARKEGFQRCFVPQENEREGQILAGIEVVGITSLAQTIEYLKNSTKVQKSSEEFFGDSNEYCNTGIDFGDIRGQSLAKRASEIAAAGFHNILYIGPPGTGKSMLAKGLSTILPPLSKTEAIEVTKIYSICGLLKNNEPVIRYRPFRAPHHTISTASLCGGGRFPTPGELTLSHKGVLFLDELTEFKPEALNAMREPLEEKQIVISRLQSTFAFPTEFLLAAAMNPCTCGYYPDRKKCHCQVKAVKRYFNRISGPLLDRLDILVEVPNQSYDVFAAEQDMESSEAVRRRVTAARMLQLKRYQGTGFDFNGAIPTPLVEQYCSLGTAEGACLKRLFSRYEFSSRKYHRLLRVARTIADLQQEEFIKEQHLNEAVFYQTLDEKYRGEYNE